MKFLTLTQNSGAKTIYVNEAQIISFIAQGTGTYISMSDSVNIPVDQTPSQVVALL